MSKKNRKKLEASSWLAVVRAYQECNRRYTQLLRGFALTIPQFDVLNAVRRLGQGATPHAIADELVVTRGNITGVLQRLQEHGLLQRRHHERDGRSFVCELTAAGDALLDEARLAAAEFVACQLGPFDDHTLARTEALMNRMRAHLETVDPGAILERVGKRSKPAGKEAIHS